MYGGTSETEDRRKRSEVVIENLMEIKNFTVVRKDILNMGI